MFGSSDDEFDFFTSLINFKLNMFNLNHTTKGTLFLLAKRRQPSPHMINLYRMSTSDSDGKKKPPVITKEQMKIEMLEHDYFDTEILYHGMKNPRTDDHKRGEKDLLDE